MNKKISLPKASIYILTELFSLRLCRVRYLTTLADQSVIKKLLHYNFINIIKKNYVSLTPDGIIFLSQNYFTKGLGFDRKQIQKYFLSSFNAKGMLSADFISGLVSNSQAIQRVFKNKKLFWGNFLNYSSDYQLLENGIAIPKKPLTTQGLSTKWPKLIQASWPIKKYRQNNIVVPVFNFPPPKPQPDLLFIASPFFEKNNMLQQCPIPFLFWVKFIIKDDDLILKNIYNKIISNWLNNIFSVVFYRQKNHSKIPFPLYMVFFTKYTVDHKVDVFLETLIPHIANRPTVEAIKFIFIFFAPISTINNPLIESFPYCIQLIPRPPYYKIIKNIYLLLDKS